LGHWRELDGDGWVSIGISRFDPATLMVGATVAAGAVKGISTIAGGKMAAQAGQMQQTEANYQAAQLNQNAAQALASSQRQALDTTQRTNLAISTATARAGASGAAPDVGSAVANTGELAQRGSYQALTDMFNGQSKATGLENEAAGVRYTGDVEAYEGEEKESAAYLAAGGDVLSGIGSGARLYGSVNDPGRVRL
jgi:hypothetical protein